MRPCARLLSAVLLCGLAAPALAEPFGYAAGFDRLYRIDLGNGQATELGPIGFVDVEGLAFSPEGVLYGVADGGASGGSGLTDVLLRLDTSSGAATLVGALSGLQGAGTGPFDALDYGLTFTCDGRLWLSSATTETLWQVDPASGATTEVATLGAPVSGLAAAGDVLYGISVSDDQALYRIHPDTGAATRVGALGLPLDFFDAGLDFDADGTLWATIDYFSPPEGLPEVERNDIARIDPASGQAQITSAISGAGSGIATVQMEALALAPPSCGAVEQVREVPGPGRPLLALLALLALLGGAIGLRGRVG